MSTEASTTVAAEVPPTHERRRVFHRYLPSYCSHINSGGGVTSSSTPTPVGEAARQSTDHADASHRSRLTRTLSLLAEGVSSQLYRTSTAATAATDAPKEVPTARSQRLDALSADAQSYFHPLIPDELVSSSALLLCERVYYTGTVREVERGLHVGCGDAGRPQTSRLDPHTAVPDDANGHFLHVVYGVLDADSSCPFVPRRRSGAQTTSGTLSSVNTLLQPAGTTRTPLHFPFLTTDLLRTASAGGVCTAEELVQPPFTGGVLPIATGGPPPHSESVERVVLLWLCTYQGGVDEGRRHGRGVLTVYGKFALTCMWNHDVPLVQPSAAVYASCAAWCCVLAEHRVVVEADSERSDATTSRSNAPARLASLHVRAYTGSTYMGSLALQKHRPGRHVNSPEEPQGVPSSSPSSASTTSYAGFQWLWTTQILPHGVGLLRRRTGRRNLKCDDDDDEVEAEAHVSVSGRQWGGYLSVSASPCLAGGAASLASGRSVDATRPRTGVRVEVSWYCGSWSLGLRHGFGVLVGFSTRATAGGRRPVSSRGGGEPCTYLGAFVRHQRCGPAALELDRTGTLLCGTWGVDGMLQSRVPHTLLYSGDPPFSLQGMLLHLDTPEQSAEGQVLAAAAAIRGREDDTSAPLLFDQATLVQSAGAANGVWEPLFTDFDKALSELYGTLQGESVGQAAEVAPARPVDELRMMLSRMAALSEWQTVLAGFQRCFFALYAPDEEDDVGMCDCETRSPVPHSLKSPASQCGVGAAQSAHQTHAVVSWRCEALSALFTMSTPAEARYRSCTAGVSSVSDTQLRTFTPHRARTPLALLQHAFQLMEALVTSLRLRALPLLADRPWAADLLVASAVVPGDLDSRRHTQRGGGTTSADQGSAQLAHALAEFCWTEAYKPIAPVLFRLCHVCALEDGRDGVHHLLFSGPARGAPRLLSSGSSDFAPTATPAQLFAWDWLTLFSPAAVRLWHHNAAVLSRADQYAALSLASVEAAVARCRSLSQSDFVPSDQPEHTPEATALIHEFASLCVAPVALPGSSVVFFAGSSGGPLLRWGKKKDEAGGGSRPTSAAWSLSPAADAVVSIVHHAVSLFPSSVAQQQRWLTYALLAAAKCVCAWQCDLHTDAHGIDDASVLTRVGFNPLSPLLQLHAALVRSADPLPLPELSVLLLQDLVEQLNRDRVQASGGCSDVVGGRAPVRPYEVAQDMTNVFHAVLVRLVCALEDLTRCFPAVTRSPCVAADSPTLLSEVSPHAIVMSLRDLSARGRYVLSPVAAYVAKAHARVRAASLLVVSARAGGGDEVTVDATSVCAALSKPECASSRCLVAELLGQSTEAFELALSVAGWTGSTPAATAVPVNEKSAQRAGHTESLPSSVQGEKRRATQAVRALATLWGTGAEQDKDGARPCAPEWVPATIAAKLHCQLQGVSEESSAPTSLQPHSGAAARAAARVSPTPFMQWVASCVAHALSLPRDNSASRTFRRFVPLHKAAARTVMTAETGSATVVHEVVGWAEEDVWYVILLILAFEELGWSLSLAVTLSPQRPADSRRPADAAAPVAEAGGLAGDGGARAARTHTLFSSSSSSSRTSSMSASPPVSSPPPHDSPTRRDGNPPRTSVVGVGRGLFDGSEFCLAVMPRCTCATSPGAQWGVQWQVLEQACGIVAGQC